MAANPEALPNDRPISSLDELDTVFRAVEKPADKFRIGAEAEKFAIKADGSALQYEGEDGIVGIFDALSEYGWEPERESADGPVISLRRGGASITLEPGSQLELSGAALPDLHQVEAEFYNHLRELAPISKKLGLTWLGVGFQPLATQESLTWVPKQRYAIMREYLPTKGPAAHDMMRRTATVQANYDFSSEADAMKKLVLALKLSPLIHAMLANSPFKEGKLAGTKSVRGEVWLNMDPSRSGLIPSLWTPAKRRTATTSSGRSTPACSVQARRQSRGQHRPNLPRLHERRLRRPQSAAQRLEAAPADAVPRSSPQEHPRSARL